MTEEVEKAAKKALSKKEESELLSYEKAKHLVGIFTDIPSVTALVGVEFDECHGKKIGKMPDAPNVREVMITYYMGDDENTERENSLLCLRISAHLVPYLDDEKSIDFGILTSVEETKDKGRKEIFLKRASLMGQIASKLESLQRDSCDY